MIPIIETIVVMSVGAYVLTGVGLGQFILAIATAYTVYWAWERSYVSSVLIRRDLLRVGSRGVESGDSNSAVTSKQAQTQNSGSGLFSLRSFIIRASLVSLVLLGPVVGSGAAEASMVGPEEAIDQRSEALERLAELERLSSDPLISVDQSTLETVHTRIEQGNISYKRANYDTASDHWHVASEQARTALIRHYNLGADRYLNATSHYLSERETAGYNSPEMSQFRQQAQQIRTENTSGLQESRNRYEAAQNLDSTVESELPSMDAVDWANDLSPLWRSAVIVAGALLVLSSSAGYFGYRRGKGQTPEAVVEDDDGDNDGDGDGDGDDDTETPSTLRGG